MAFPDVLRIAKQQYRATMRAPVTFFPVPEWLDYQGQAIVLHVFRLSGDDAEAVAIARRDYGEKGAAAMTVARACYVIDGTDKKRAFVDTDLPDMLKAVDFAIIDRIYSIVLEAYAGPR